jgi:hypothetical protein
VDDAGLLEDLQMVSQQVARQRESAGQLARRRIAENQSVDDGQPGRFAQRRVDAGTVGQHVRALLATHRHDRRPPK